MNRDISSSWENSGEPILPDDFARNVLREARRKLRHRRLRNRVVGGAGVCLLAAAIPLAALIQARRANMGRRESSAIAKSGWQEESSDDALAYQMAQSATPRAAADYLLPNAIALTNLATTYSYNDASWQYDSNWTYGD